MAKFITHNDEDSIDTANSCVMPYDPEDDDEKDDDTGETQTKEQYGLTWESTPDDKWWHSTTVDEDDEWVMMPKDDY